MVKKDLRVSKKISELSQRELMDLIYCLNDNMKNYDSNIDRAMERSDRAEWDCLKTNKNKGVNIQYAGKKH